MSNPPTTGSAAAQGYWIKRTEIHPPLPGKDLPACRITVITPGGIRMTAQQAFTDRVKRLRKVGQRGITTEGLALTYITHDGITTTVEFSDTPPGPQGRTLEELPEATR